MKVDILQRHATEINEILSHENPCATETHIRMGPGGATSLATSVDMSSLILLKDNCQTDDSIPLNNMWLL